MAAKKSRKKKKTHHKRTAAKNPKTRAKKKRKTSHRAKASNPRKRKKTHHAKRPRRANPPKARKRHKRRHKRNPDVPVWAMAAIGAVLGLVSFTAVSAGTFALTQRLDPTLATLIRNRRIAAGLFTVGGVALAFVSPILGAGVAAGGLAVLAGTEASLALGSLIDKPAAPAAGTTPAAGATTAAAQTTKGLFSGGRQQLPNINGVYSGGRQQLPNMSGVFAQGGHQTFGNIGHEDGYGATAF